MRTAGTFQDIYKAAKNYATESGEHRPMDPVVRREDGRWILESSLEPTDGDFEISLEEFDSYFWESYQCAGYAPTDDDVEEFVEAFGA